MAKWTSKKLADVVELRRGFDLPTRVREPGEFPVLSAGVTAGWHNEGPIKGPGFVVGRATNLGIPTWSDTDFWPLNTTLYAADFKGNNPRFLFHLFESIDLAGFDSGSVQPMLNRNYIAGVDVRIPDLATQEAIADVLGAIDFKLAANVRTANIVSNLADALFMASFRREMETTTTLGELADSGVLNLGDGYRTKRDEHGQPGFRILRAGDVQNGRVIPEGADFVSDSCRQQIGKKLSHPGDIILTTKGSVGRVAVVPPDLETVVYSPQICYFRVIDGETIDRNYLAAWFRSPDLQSQASQLMFKSDMAPYINLRDIRSLSVPIPCWADQRRQGELQGSLQEVFQAVHSENNQLRRTRDELLPLLMSGKIHVRDAEKVAEEIV
jgi:type I restriction enzyme, S subunit